jgi:DNA-binding MarR family transcriptional regulator
MVSMKTKTRAVAEINTLLRELATKFDTTDGDAERDYMAEHCPDHLDRTVRELPTLAVHLLDHIAEEPVSVIGLAARSGQLKGTVSKHVQRLVEAGLVERVPVPGNRKEVTLSVTKDGETFARVHQRMHQEMDRGLEDFLLRYSATELATVIKILDDLRKSERVGVRLRPARDT